MRTLDAPLRSVERNILAAGEDSLRHGEVLLSACAAAHTATCLRALVYLQVKHADMTCRHRVRDVTNWIRLQLDMLALSVQYAESLALLALLAASAMPTCL